MHLPLPWLRLYTEFASDPKIQILAFEDQRHFMMLLCLKGNGTLDADSPSQEYRERLIAKALGLAGPEAFSAKVRLRDAGLIADDWQPLKWDERQFKSDRSTERVREYRKRHSNVTVTGKIRVRADTYKEPPKGGFQAVGKTAEQIREDLELARQAAAVRKAYETP
jgi:hypothetical protein